MIATVRRSASGETSTERPKPTCEICGDERFVFVTQCSVEEGRIWDKDYERLILVAEMNLTQAEALAERELLHAGENVRDQRKIAHDKAISRNRSKLEDLEVRYDRGYGGQNVAVPCWSPVHGIERVERLRDGAGSSKDMRFDTFQKIVGTERAFEKMREVGSGDSTENIIVLTGDYGCGKTHLLSAVINCRVDAGEMAFLRYTPAVLDEIRAAIDRHEVAEVVDRYVGLGILGLDDFGAGRRDPSGWAVEQMERIIDARYREGPLLILTTNLGPTQLADAWGGRIADRLMDTQSGRVAHIRIDAPSYRSGLTW
jgi:DNA replication protein DnaC